MALSLQVGIQNAIMDNSCLTVEGVLLFGSGKAILLDDICFNAGLEWIFMGLISRVFEILASQDRKNRRQSIKSHIFNIKTYHLCHILCGPAFLLDA